jgi:hypothetical protein
LRKYDGIYYVSYKGFPPDKALAIQIVVAPELPDSEFLLKAVAPGCGRETIRKAMEILNGNSERAGTLEHWKDVVLSINEITITEEMNKMNKKDRVKLAKLMAQKGLLVDYELKWKREGRQEGRQEVLALLDEKTRKRVQLVL